MSHCLLQQQKSRKRNKTIHWSLVALLAASAETQMVDKKPGQCVSLVYTTGDEFIGNAAQPTLAQVQKQKKPYNFQRMAIPHVSVYTLPLISTGLDSSTLQIWEAPARHETSSRPQVRLSIRNCSGGWVQHRHGYVYNKQHTELELNTY